jgi:hypothetical protein
MPVFIPINDNYIPMKKVTGIGGIFFKCKDPKALKGNRRQRVWSDF